VTLRNVGGAITGPVSLVLDNLTRRVRLRKPTGFTVLHPPVSPFRDVPLVSGNTFNTGETLTIVLEFRNPLGKRVRFGTRVLAGAGQR
jgi:hypothetical protein